RLPHPEAGPHCATRAAPLPIRRPRLEPATRLRFPSAGSSIDRPSGASPAHRDRETRALRPLTSNRGIPPRLYAPALRHLQIGPAFRTELATRISVAGHAG